MGIYIGVNETARTAKAVYVGVDGIARRVTKAYVGADGGARQVWPTQSQLRDYPVGSVVTLAEKNGPAEFIVSAHDREVLSGIYRSLLVRRECFQQLSKDDLDIAARAYAQLMLDPAVAAAIAIDASGFAHNGVSMLSLGMLGLRLAGYPVSDEQPLANAAQMLIATFSGAPIDQWLSNTRSGSAGQSYRAYVTRTGGAAETSNSNTLTQLGYRPMLLMPSEALFDGGTFVGME